MIVGIDVSEHNGAIDWKYLKEWGIGFAILRLGYGKGHLDGRFYEYINGALDAGIPAGAYYYSYALTEAEAGTEAWFSAYVLQDCGVTPEHLPLGVWYDMEDADGWKASHGMPESGEITAMCATYTREIGRYGYPCGVYASYDWLMHRIERQQLSPYMPYWVAQWGPVCDFPGADIWQYTDCLRIGGKAYDGDFLLEDGTAKAIRLMEERE